MTFAIKDDIARDELQAHLSQLLMPRKVHLHASSSETYPEVGDDDFCISYWHEDGCFKVLFEVMYKRFVNDALLEARFDLGLARNLSLLIDSEVLCGSSMLRELNVPDADLVEPVYASTLWREGKAWLVDDFELEFEFNFESIETALAVIKALNLPMDLWGELGLIIDVW